MGDFLGKLILVLAIMFLVACGLVRFSFWLGEVVVKAETGRLTAAMKQAE